MLDLRLKRLLTNLKDFPFDIKDYRIDEQQGKGIIEALEELDASDCDYSKVIRRNTRNE